MLGPLAYLLAAVRVLGEKPPQMRVTLADGRIVEGVAVLAGNGSLYGGPFPFFRKADNHDSKLDVLVYKEAGYRLVLDSLRGLALGGIDFRLSRPARERVEAELIQRSIASLNARMAAVAQAMNVPPARLRTEELNFGVQDAVRPMAMMARAAPMLASDQVAEPQFDAGRSLQQMTVTGRVRLLPLQ